MEINFKREFVDFDFDALVAHDVIKNNKHLYTSHKQAYMETAKRNLPLYNAYIKDFKLLKSCNHTISGDTITYTFVDERKMQEVKKNIKDILTRQRRDVQNMIAYIKWLNDNINEHNGHNEPKTQKGKRKTLMSMFY